MSCDTQETKLLCPIARVCTSPRLMRSASSRRRPWRASKQKTTTPAVVPRDLRLPAVKAKFASGQAIGKLTSTKLLRAHGSLPCTARKLDDRTIVDSAAAAYPGESAVNTLGPSVVAAVPKPFVKYVRCSTPRGSASPSKNDSRQSNAPHQMNDAEPAHALQQSVCNGAFFACARARKHSQLTAYFQPPTAVACDPAH